MRAVGTFGIAAILFSVPVWFNDPWLGILALSPIGSDHAQSLFPVSLLTYGFVHYGLVFLLFSLFQVGLYGFILEPRIGTRATAFVILAGILVSGLFWIVFGAKHTFLTGSTGALYAMIGGLIYLWHKRGQELALAERIVIGFVVVWTALGLLSSLVSYGSPWTTAMGLPVGYVVGLWFDRERIHPGRAQ